MAGIEQEFAFPGKHEWSGVSMNHPGMDIRDFFAGMAISSSTTFENGDPRNAREIAKRAYEIADAMILFSRGK